MFYIECPNKDKRLALNLAACQKLETKIDKRRPRKKYFITMFSRQQGSIEIGFDTEEEMLETFDKLMTALKNCQAHFLSPHPLEKN